MNGDGTLVLKQKKLPVVTFATVLVTIWNINRPFQLVHFVFPFQTM